MQEDILKAVGGHIAGDARDEVVSEGLDFIADAAKKELERRHPVLSAEGPECNAIARAIASDDLDAQIPKTCPADQIADRTADAKVGAAENG